MSSVYAWGEEGSDRRPPTLGTIMMCTVSRKFSVLALRPNGRGSGLKEGSNFFFFFLFFLDYK